MNYPTLFPRPRFLVLPLLVLEIPLSGNVFLTSGSVVLEPAPFPPESNSEIFVFNEQQDVPFVASQPLDFGSIIPGTLVNSHYIQFDPVNPTGSIGSGSMTFEGPVIGVITSSEFLTADLSADLAGSSDTYFGLETSLGAYPAANASFRGLGSAEDDLIINLGSNLLGIDSLDIPVSGALDGFRVLTDASITLIPEPAIFSLALGFLLFIAAGGRRHRS